MTGMAGRIRVWLVVTAGLLLVFGVGPSAGARQASQEKQVLVTVMNLKTGTPVPGVTAAALAVKEDGSEREILKVEPASGPISVVLLADTTSIFTPFVKELRASTQGFITAFMAKNAGSAISLWKFGGAGVAVTQFLEDAAKLNEEAAKLRPVDVVDKISSEQGSNLLEGIVDGAKALGKRPGNRRVIVSFNAVTASEASKVQKSQVQSELQKNGAAWFGVTFADGGTGSPMRDSLMAETLPLSGGLRLTIQDVARLEAAMKALVDIVSAQYVVTYKRASGSPKEVVVEAKGEGLRAYNPHWAPK